jgi:hypothetical protein
MARCGSRTLLASCAASYRHIRIRIPVIRAAGTAPVMSVSLLAAEIVQGEIRIAVTATHISALLLSLV